MNSYQKPNYVHSKTDLDRIVILGETVESKTIEFKQNLNLPKDNSAEETALDICQFINSAGGVILVGVVEKRNERTGKHVAHSFINVDHNNILQFINDKVLPIIHPRSISIDIASIAVSKEKNITAINVGPLAKGVACVAQNTPPYPGKYPYRTHYGKKYYNPLEVEKIMTNNNRYLFLKPNEMFKHDKEVALYPSISKKEADRNLSWDSKDSTVILKEVNDSEYKLNIAGIDINIPYSITRDAWITEDNKIGILLEIKLVVSSDRRTILFDL